MAAATTRPTRASRSKAGRCRQCCAENSWCAMASSPASPATAPTWRGKNRRWRRHGARPEGLVLQFCVDLEARLRLFGDFVERHVRSKLDQRHAALLLVDVEHPEIGDHHVDNAGAGERQVALM